MVLNQKDSESFRESPFLILTSDYNYPSANILLVILAFISSSIFSWII